MEQYHQIITESPEPLRTLVLSRKTGKIPKGTYAFTEYYCTDPKCDCRRVVISVLNEKMKQKAVIDFGFDQDSPFSGPYLDQSNHQSPYAEELLKFFVDSLNSGGMWLDRLYRHYREVREKVEGRPYHGKPFPKPGQLVYRVMPPPDLEAEILQSLENLRGNRPAPSAPQRPQRPVAPKAPATQAAITRQEPTMASLVSRYAEVEVAGPIEKQLTLKKDLKNYLLAKEDSGGDLAKFLPELCQQSPQDDEKINSSLRLLFDALNLIEEEMETGREDAKRRMQTLQEALARHVYQENEDLDLHAAVSNILIQSRVDMLPALRLATTKMIASAVQRSDLHETAGEDVLTGIARSLHSMGVTSPFEAADEILQLLRLNEADMQTALIGEMLAADKPLLRDLAALLIFHPEPAVRVGVSQLLASAEGGMMTPETLRRLIVSRNWLSENYRKEVDKAITNARKARVECAPLARPDSLTVYSSSIDGAGEQVLLAIVPDGSGFARCSVTVQQGVGITGVNVSSLKSKGEVGSYLALLKKEPRYLEASSEYLDLRTCHALADGAATDHPPSHWLVRVAELLGRDRWLGIAFDPHRELLSLWEELDAHDRKFLEQKEYDAALSASGEWRLTGSFLSSWYENDEAVDKEISGASGRKKSDPEAAVAYLLAEAQQTRRRRWLERIVVTAMLLKSCRRPPVPWHQMFHVAQAVADETVPLKDIPLMVNIAAATVSAFMKNNE